MYTVSIMSLDHINDTREATKTVLGYYSYNVFISWSKQSTYNINVLW